MGANQIDYLEIVEGNNGRYFVGCVSWTCAYTSTGSGDAARVHLLRRPGPRVGAAGCATWPGEVRGTGRGRGLVDAGVEEIVGVGGGRSTRRVTLAAADVPHVGTAGRTTWPGGD